MNDEELSFSGLLAAAARMEEVKNLISNPEHLAVMTILFQIISADFWHISLFQAATTEMARRRTEEAIIRWW